LITGLLSRPVDQQDAELLQRQPGNPGSRNGDDHRSVAFGKPQSRPQP
jgi:hypothetical protein